MYFPQKLCFPIQLQKNISPPGMSHPVPIPFFITYLIHGVESRLNLNLMILKIFTFFCLQRLLLWGVTKTSEEGKATSKDGLREKKKKV